MFPKIATIINYCTHDYRFLRYCVQEAAKFSSQIIIPVCSHFFNGKKENQALLNQSYTEHPNVEFIEFAYSSKPYGIYSALTSKDEDWNHYWHSTARYVGYHFVKESDFILFLDVDEIVDADRFIEWFSQFPLTDYAALRFSSFFYFREPQYRALHKWPLNALLINRKFMPEPEIILDIFERRGLYDQIQGPKINDICGIDQKPMVHHYSWVRSSQEIQHKVQTWGHLHDKNWQPLIDQEWGSSFSGIDRIHGFHYETVPVLHDVLQKIEFKHTTKTSFPNVQKIDRASLFKKNIQKML
jgi:hypothetical protein